MKANVQMVMIASKSLNATEQAIISIALIYNSGHWRKDVQLADCEAAYEEYLRGDVDWVLTDFCLDYLSGRIHPNLLMNVLTSLSNVKLRHKTR